MELFEAAHRWEAKSLPSLPKICYAYPTMMKLGTVIPYLKKIQKLYEFCDTPLEAFFHRKLKHFATLRNTDIDLILVYNF